jgi:acyl-CoA thioester hydrolase
MSEKFAFYDKLRVRYAEIDGNKIVFNAHYMTFMDNANIEYFREILGEHWLEEYEPRFNPVLRKSTVEYIRPALLDDVLLVGCRTVRLGKSSFTCRYVITRQGEDEQSLIEGEITYVNVDIVSGKPKPIPDDVRLKIIQFENNPELAAV